MYPQQMTEEEMLMLQMQQAMQRQGAYGPMGNPMSMQSQQADALRQVDPSKIPGMPQAPGMPPSPSSLDQKFTIPQAPDQTGARADIANKRALGRSLLAKGTPSGRTVGPSNIYVQNYGEGVASGLEKALGGYLTASTGKEAKVLDAEATQAKEDIAEAEARVAAYQEEQRLKERGEDYAVDVGTLQTRRDANRVAAAGDWKAKPVHLPEAYGGGEGTLVYNEKLGEWRRGNAQGDVVPAETAEKILEYTASTTTGSTSPTERRDAQEKSVLMGTLAESAAEIERLAAQGESTSGLKGTFIDALPNALKGPAEAWLYSGDAQKQRAVNTYVDAQMIKVLNKGVATEGDVSRLMGIRLGVGGLGPEQQLYRIEAINRILDKYGEPLDLSGDLDTAAEVAKSVTVTSQADYDKLKPGSYFIEDGKTYRKPLEEED